MIINHRKPFIDIPFLTEPSLRRLVFSVPNEIQLLRMAVIPHVPSVDDAENTCKGWSVSVWIIEGVDEPQGAVAHVFCVIAVTVDGASVLVKRSRNNKPVAPHRRLLGAHSPGMDAHSVAHAEVAPVVRDVTFHHNPYPMVPVREACMADAAVARFVFLNEKGRVSGSESEVFVCVRGQFARVYRLFQCVAEWPFVARQDKVDAVDGDNCYDNDDESFAHVVMIICLQK